jgi:predicted nicotinamide N-methyase
VPDVAHYIAVVASTALRPTPLVPEVSLYCADDAYVVWTLTAAAAAVSTFPNATSEPAPLPFWSFPWAGGQALARYVLDHPDIVAGRRVLDLAAGSGLVAIAAALAGARVVTANDVDPYATAAQELNAKANDVRLTIVTGDLLDDGDGIGGDADVVLAGDVWYDRELADRMLAYLLRARQRGAEVLLGDPGRTYLPRAHLEEVAAYDVPTTLALEDQQTKRTTIWRLPSSPPSRPPSSRPPSSPPPSWR